MNAVNLRCEYSANPLGIDRQNPRLSWVLSSPHRGEGQTCFQVLAASTANLLNQDIGDLCNHKMASSETLGFTYSGKPLKPGQRVYWKVRVWDNKSRLGKYSDPAWFELGLLNQQNWKAQWITTTDPVPADEKALYDDRPNPLLRKEFTVSKAIKRARAYVSGLGYYELRLNGEKVGDHVLDPGWTDYSKRVLYSTYDVTAQLKKGRNAVAFMLGGGWYDPLPIRLFGRFDRRERLTIGRPRAILQMEIEYTDGSHEIVSTDTTWKAGHGPLLRNDIYLGEVYDGRRELFGWDKTGFNDSSWGPTVVSSDAVGPLVAQTAPPIRITRTVKPVKLSNPSKGVFIFDMGQNFAGWVTLKVKGGPGTQVTMRYGELLLPNGNINVLTSCCGQVKGGNGGPGAPRVADQRDVYILKGGGAEQYTPRFTWHGFRYVEITGLPDEPKLVDIVGHRLNSDVEPVGSFSCSNEMFNRIQTMVEWTLLSNLFSVQSDCPHRERLGYGGDIVATSEMGMLNYDMAHFYAKAVEDLADAARPNGGITETAPFIGITDEGLGGGSGPIGWGTAFPLLQWQLYQYYGDRSVLTEQYSAVKRWIELVKSNAKDGILINGISDHESLVPKPVPLTGTAFYYLNVKLAEKIAGLLGHADDAESYRKLASQIYDAFNARFLTRETGQYFTGTQACQAFSLTLGLTPAESRDAVLQYLVHDIEEAHKGHLTTGIFGTKYMLEALTDLGRADVAYNMVNQKTFPGWGFMLEHGATTLWEHWDFSDNVYSHNHPMFGSVSEWFYKALAGINQGPDSVGFDKIVIKPNIVGDLKWVKGKYRSVRGEIVSEWRLDNQMLTMTVTIPANTTATIYVPTTDMQSVKEGAVSADKAEGVHFLRNECKAAVYSVGSGTYHFSSRI